MAQLGFYYDMTACTGCKTCQIACKDVNELKVGVLFRRVDTFEEGKFPYPLVFNVSISCNHCAKPRCVENCPTGAMYKRESDGVVVVNEKKCIGCKYCQWSCPYGAPQYLADKGKIGKCNYCIDKLDKGEEPACIASCPTRALHGGPIDDLRKNYGGTADMNKLPDASLTQPSLTVTLKKEAMK
jgi:anaerobic dimethyl sulfoxide reductase subunit B (iron-sulfur subunit)